jgi:hypothetical protein
MSTYKWKRYGNLTCNTCEVFLFLSSRRVSLDAKCPITISKSEKYINENKKFRNSFQVVENIL